MKTKKVDKSNEDIKGKVIEKKEENQFLLNINKELKEQLKKHKDEGQMQEQIIKKIQSENKQLKNKLKGIQNKTSKSLEIQFMEKRTLIDPVQIITLDVALVEENPTQILIQRDTTNLIREIDVEKIPYRHPNHSSWYLKNRKQSTEIIDTRALNSQDVSSLRKCDVQQRINLGWIDPSTYQKLHSTLRSSYDLCRQPQHCTEQCDHIIRL